MTTMEISAEQHGPQMVIRFHAGGKGGVTKWRKLIILEKLHA